MRSRVSACWSFISEVSTTKTNGSTKKSAAAMPSECTAIQCSSALRRAVRAAGVCGAFAGEAGAGLSRSWVMAQSPAWIRLLRPRMSSAVKAMARANRMRATTQAAP